jgi:hypothetical protein
MSNGAVPPQLLALTAEQLDLILGRITAAATPVAAAAAVTAAAASASSSAVVAQQQRTRMKLNPATIYSGHANALDKWERQMQQQFDFYQYTSDADRVAFACAHLGDVPLEWWNTLDAAVKAAASASYAAFLAAVRRRFQPLNISQTARIALDSLRQGPRQSVADYIAHFRRLLTSVPTMAQEDRVHRFVQGLRQGAVQQQVVLRNPATLDAAIEAATLVGSLGQLAASSAASAAGPGHHYGGDAMDVSSLDLFGIEGLEYETDAPHSADAGAAHAAASLRAENARLRQELNAMRSHQRGGAAERGGKQSGFGGRRRPLPHTAGLSEQQIAARLAARACFCCGESGHRAADCPKRGSSESTN